MSNAPAAAHALDVLEHLSRHAEPVPAASIARDLGLPRSSVYHLLRVLHARGYVTHYVEERRFGLGQSAYELGSAYQRQAPLARVARAAMRRLVDQVGRNAHFATLDGRDVIYLLEERAAGQPMLVTDVGVRLPAHLTASGLAMLSALPGEPGARALSRPGELRAAARHRTAVAARAAQHARPGCAPAAMPSRRARSHPTSRRWPCRCSTGRGGRSPPSPSRCAPTTRLPSTWPSW